jgi:glutamate-1-semialdehyde 2,1-aminomutase
MIDNFSKSLSLQKRFNDLIPGGGHTYAKGDDQFPEFSPMYIDRGTGSHVWDIDGNEFIEYGSGLRAVTLGHAYPSIVEVASSALKGGSNFVRPAILELTCAEKLVEMIPGAEMVKFAKNGSDANNGAVKLARAYTGRDLVAICENHPFFSIEDWFIGTTPMSAGIPTAIQELTVKFRYNDIDSVHQLFKKNKDRIACVILEPEKEQPPADQFLHQVQEICRRNGALFIFDEMITGFRWHNGGGQTFHGITPDLSTFGKALANGFSVSALVGKREIMRLGGTNHTRERVFLLSTTHGAESHALAACIETLRVYSEEPVIKHLWSQGDKLAEGVRVAIRAHGLEGYVDVLGRPCCLVYATRDQEMKPSQGFRTLFLQELIKRGILATSFVDSYSHTDKDIEVTIRAVDESLGVYSEALKKGLGEFLRGRPVKPVFRKFN